jgi:hypothetical protein
VAHRTTIPTARLAPTSSRCGREADAIRVEPEGEPPNDRTPELLRPVVAPGDHLEVIERELPLET